MTSEVKRNVVECEPCVPYWDLFAPGVI